MERCTDEAVAEMLPMVSAQRREQALRYKHTLGQFCCLKSWGMLKEGLQIEDWRFKIEDWRFRDLEWQFNEHGKPFIPGGPYFSISHCKEGIAVAISDEPIGIDIEGIRHADEELIRRTMNEEERLWVTGEGLRVTGYGLRDRRFTRLWTQKEAVVKAIGTGIVSFEQLQTILDNGQWALETFETEKYIYSIAYGKLHCFGA
jgi:4'-phosphopantetheinyl transferase